MDEIVYSKLDRYAELLDMERGEEVQAEMLALWNDLHDAGLHDEEIGYYVNVGRFN